MPKRKTFTASHKAAIALEALREGKTVAQIASENGVHPTQIHKWKKQAQENFQQLFEDDRKGEKALALASRQADLVCVSYSSLFYQPAPPSQRELEIKRRIDEVYTATPFYGSRQIAVTLRPEFGVLRPQYKPICARWALQASR